MLSGHRACPAFSRLLISSMNKTRCVVHTVITALKRRQEAQKFNTVLSYTRSEEPAWAPRDSYRHQ